MSHAPTRTVVVLAAGEGKRMKSAVPKMLHELLGRTLLGHVLAAAAPLAAARTVLVVGRGADQVTAHAAEIAPYAEPVLQAEQNGTGHAARIALDAVPASVGTVLVLNADVPLLRPETLSALAEAHETSGAAATILTAEVPDPHGLGRIIRDGEDVVAIVEERDATSAQRAIREINGGIYAFDAGLLREALSKLSTDNDQGEEYLTDVVGLFVDAGHRVGAYVAADVTETYGCNDRAQLADLRYLLRDRINRDWMRSGVTMVDPATTFLDVTVRLAPDVTIEPNTQLRGSTTVGAGALVGPDTTLTDCAIAERATVVRTHGVQAEVGPGASVGPFAYLRPGTRLAASAKVGTFVETKNAELGEGAKVPHLSYVGDATIGARANIGAATIFVNYDGVNKHHTEVGEAAFVGCNTNLVAPVTVGDGAYVAAGSTVIKNVPSGALGVARSEQRSVDGWVERRRAGTRSAEASARARARADDAARARAAADDPQTVASDQRDTDK